MIEINENSTENTVAASANNKLSKSEIVLKRRNSKAKGVSSNDLNMNTDRESIGMNNAYEDIENGKKIINNYVQITNIININENFNVNSISPRIGMQIDANSPKKNSFLNNFRKSSKIFYFIKL